MKAPLLIASCLCVVLVTSFESGAADIKLEPNATFRLEFPDLPDTLETLASGEKQAARLTATLPSNYSRAGKFPVFIFLDGDKGGRGDGLPIPGRKVVPIDFICVALPLFKRAYHEDEGAVITMEDYETISRAYRVMLQRLFSVVPNATPERSALGGFSNGAHAVAVLLAAHDEFILRHFQAFYFIEGGFGPLAANVLQTPAMRHCRFLLFREDRPEAEPEPKAHLSLALEYVAQKHHVDFTSIVMKGFGHELPSEYLSLLGQWIRGERLSEAAGQQPLQK
jgi:predicted esterase